MEGSFALAGGTSAKKIDLRSKVARLQLGNLHAALIAIPDILAGIASLLTLERDSPDHSGYWTFPEKKSLWFILGSKAKHKLSLSGESLTFTVQKMRTFFSRKKIYFHREKNI